MTDDWHAWTDEDPMLSRRGNGITVRFDPHPVGGRRKQEVEVISHEFGWELSSRSTPHAGDDLSEAGAQLLGSVDVPKTIARRRDGKGVFYRAFDVEAYLMRLRPERLWTVDLRNGSFQMLSQSLFVVFRNYFRHAVCKLLVQIVNIQNISDFLCTRAESRSVFERFDIREKNGTLCRVTSHQFRHWLNYIADKGGLPVDLQTRWMGRDNPRDTEAYRHATVDERIEWVKQGIREGSMGGTKAGAYFDLPRARRDQFLETEIQAVHMTAFGLHYVTHRSAARLIAGYQDSSMSC